MTEEGLDEVDGCDICLLTRVQSSGPFGQLFIRWPVARQEKQNLLAGGGFFDDWEGEGWFRGPDF